MNSGANDARVNALTVKAFAKINLALGVAAPNPPTHARPGFHEIASWMTPIGLHDEVRIEPLAPADASRSGLSIEWAADAPKITPLDWPVEKDLAFRAWRLLEEATGRSMPARITLRKRVPVGGGLGGGSADAAAALLGLRARFCPAFSLDRLRLLASALGSDVPFFIDDVPLDAPPRPAIVSGLGERLERTPVLGGSLLLIVPSFGCPTGPVYKAFDALATTLPGKDAQLDRVRALAAAPLESHRLFNDLAPAAESVAPALAPIRASLAAALQVPVHVTGSGSCLFALAPAGLEEVKRSAWIREVEAASCVPVWTTLAAPSS
jgi:4-diphosphocytidyl-2-C-methyl-D-erythritol kinase